MTNNYDELFKIETGNQGSIKAKSKHDSPYEATPYSFLARLFDELPLTKEDRLVDFGSGKGRLLFYLHDRFRLRVTGVEKSEELHQIARKNKDIYCKERKGARQQINLINQSAENYNLRKEDNIFYFFNPFSLTIFKQVITNILSSAQQYNRPIRLIFYYPRQKYIDYLIDTPFRLEQEILIPGLSRINPQERFLIYKL